MSFWKDILLKFLDAEKQVENLSRKIENEITRKLRKLKRKILGLIFSTVFFMLALGFLSIGFILFLSRFLPLDVLVLILGFLFFLIGIVIFLFN